MGKESNEEKQFSEDVDRLLAGQDVEGGKDAGEDYRAAINFAKKLTGFHTDPSPHFKAELKERLLLELAKQESAARQKTKGNRFWGGLKNLLPQEAVWRNATATAVLMLVAVGVLWGTGVFTPSATSEIELAPEGTFLPLPGFDLEMALDKIIELNQARTAGGLNITLQQVVLSPEGITFSAFATPPDYSLPQDFQGPMPPGVAPAVAEYIVDGITRYAGDAEATFLENGILLTWSYSQPSLALGPVPDDATEIVFTIISFGGWQGPWEFIIPLQD